jgi:hypothetical protein
MTLTHDDIFKVLQVGKPVSIIRAGDGENIVLESNIGLPEYQLCIKSVMERQMGYEPTMGDVNKIRENLVSAYAGADIVGLPAHKNLVNLNTHWKGVEKTVKPLCSTDKFTSTDVGYDMVYNGMMDKWLMGKKTIIYIGCRDIDEGLRLRYGTVHIHSYIIPPEAKFTSGYKGERHYPEMFNKIEWWLDAAKCEGNPCLVGAGVIGKIYCNWMRDRGGVAFDIGAVMDLWAGFSTRGPNRGLDVKDETYKL